MINPNEITSKKFEKSAFGYKSDDVDSFLREVAASFGAMIKDNEDKEAKILKLVETVNQYREEENTIKSAILGAQKQGNQIVAEAQAQADKILKEANSEFSDKERAALEASETSLADAEEKCERLIKEATEKSEQIIATVQEQYQIEKENLDKLKLEVTNFKANLTELYNKQLRLIMDLPELEEEEIASMNEEIDGFDFVEEKVEQDEDASDLESTPNESEEGVSLVEEDENKEKHSTFPFSDNLKSHSSFGDLKFGQNK